MLASELIIQLKKCIDASGDREIRIEDSEEGWYTPEYCTNGTEAILLD